MSFNFGGLRVSRLLVVCAVASMSGAAQLRAADFGPGFRTQAMAVEGGKRV